MKLPLIFTLLIGGLTATSSLADTLIGLKDKGWASYYAGFQGSGLEIGVDTKGQVELYFTPKKGQRLNRAWPIEAQIRVERREKGKEKWVKKTTQSDGFTTEGKVELGQEKIEYEASVTGGVKYKVKVTGYRQVSSSYAQNWPGRATGYVDG